MAAAICQALLFKVHVDLVCMTVADRIGNRLLNAAINREVDGFPVGLLDRPHGRLNLRVGMAALKTRRELHDEVAQLDLAKWARTKLLEERPIHGLQALLRSARFMAFKRSAIESISPARLVILVARSPDN